MAKQWQILDSVQTGEGTLELRKRGEKDFLITIAGRVLMNSLANRSEIVLSELACKAMSHRKNPRVLIGGLGMGCTLRGALDVLPPDAKVVVAELNEEIAGWCEGPLAVLTENAVSDPRVTVKIADVADLILDAAKEGGSKRFDAVILDLYEGPFEAAKERGEPFYGAAALDLTRTALMPGGVFAVWTEDPDKAFEKRLERAGFSFEKHRPGRGGLRHLVYIAGKRKK
ncbi:MAG: spermidine synthase [Deltaproteobacteria bacterium]|nr:spermidine synthase [Deltaproteobacteria bacterium]